jgi:hypothetical protein
MIKTFLKHQVLEACINLVFEGITKAFKQPERRYEIIDRRTEGPDDAGFMKTIITYKANGETYTLVMSQQGDIREVFTSIHGMTKEQANREIEDVIAFEIENQIRSNEIGSDAAWEEQKNNMGIPPLPGGEISEGMFDDIPEVTMEDIERINRATIENMPPEMREQFEALKQKGFPLGSDGEIEIGFDLDANPQ